MNDTFLNDIPYEKLRLLGITREAADNLPLDIRRDLAGGKMTSLLQVDINTSNGNVVSMPVKLQLVEGKNGQQLLMVYPVRRDLSIETSEKFGLSSYESARLMKGDVLIKEMDIDGKRNLNYLQLDPETNSVLRRPISEIRMEERLREINKINDIEIGVNQIQQARDGKPIELNVGDEKVTVGVDLREPPGYKVFKGDMQEWNQQQQIRYDIEHPEFIGLVQTEENKWEYKQIQDKHSNKKDMSSEKTNSLKL